MKIAGVFNHIQIRTRLLLILMAVLLPLLVLTGIAVMTQNRAIDFGQKEIYGVLYNRQVVALMEELQQRRAADSGLLPPTTGQQKSASRDQAQRLMGAIDQLSQEYGNSLVIEQRWSAIHSRLQKVLAAKKPVEAAEYNAIIERLLDLNDYVGDTSNLILDPDIDSYYLMDITLLRIPRLQEYLGQIQIKGSRLLNDREDLDNSLLVLLSEKIVLAESQLEAIEISYQKAVRYNPELAQQILIAGQIKAARKFLNDSRLLVLGSADFRSPSAYEKDGFAAMEQLFRLYQQTAQVQQLLLEIRISAFRREQILSMVAVAIMIALSIVLLLLVGRSITHSVHNLKQTIADLASGEGDLTRKIEIPGKDELSQTGIWMNRFIESMIAMISKIREQSNRLHEITTALNESILSFNQTAQDQAAATEESTAAVEELVSSFESISQAIEKQTTNIRDAGRDLDQLHTNISNASESMQSLRSSTETTNLLTTNGLNAVREVERAVENIRERAQRVNEILIIINDISNQTNLLALNASIEAARAGENGRGFAVVAEEISRLADQTATNTRDISALIQDTDQAVALGIARVQEATAQLSSISDAIAQIAVVSEETNRLQAEQRRSADSIQLVMKGITDISAEIEVATAEQTRGGNEIGNSVASISSGADSILHETEAMRRTGMELNAVAQNLRDLIVRFRI
ncbi:MAG: methyl-accepting chemotaxis protein [Leptospiraceae bacterium]|nr:methyl-accepting chemotaxis protein [Leptospiraceae bacterium]